MIEFSLNLERHRTIDIEIRNNMVISKVSYYPFASYFYNHKTYVYIGIDDNSKEMLEEVEKYLRSKSIDYEIKYTQKLTK